MSFCYRSRNGGLGFVVGHAAGSNRAAPPPPPFCLVSRGLSWLDPLSNASRAQPSRNRSSQCVYFYKSVPGKKLQLFKFYQISLKICTYQKELPPWVPEITVRNPAWACGWTCRSDCVDPHPLTLNERWGADSGRDSLPLLPETGVCCGRGRAVSTASKTKPFTEPCSCSSKVLTALKPCVSRCPWMGHIPSLLRKMRGVSVLYCLSVADMSPRMRQFPGLLQPRREFPSLMSLHFILHFAWLWWKACPLSQLVVFPLFSIFLFLLVLEE